jgi:hypothetical protein
MPYLNTLFNNHFESVSADIDASNALPTVTDVEVSHYEHIFRYPTLQSLHDFVCNKEAYMHALLFELGTYVRQVDENQNSCLKL